MKNHKFISLLFIAIFFLLGISFSYSQQYTLSGIVADVESQQRLSSVTILNQTQKTKAVSDTRGHFNISAMNGDTLFFSLLGYDSHSFIIRNDNDILISLRKNAILLDQVNIQRQSRESEMAEVLESYKRHGVYQGGKPSVLSYIFMPITSLYERFSAKGKQARRFNNYVESEIQAIHVDRLFNRNKVQNLTKLDGEDLNNFMIIYRPTFQDSRYWVEYDINAYILTALELFDKEGRPQPYRLPRIDSLTRF